MPACSVIDFGYNMVHKSTFTLIHCNTSFVSSVNAMRRTLQVCDQLAEVAVDFHVKFDIVSLHVVG